MAYGAFNRSGMPSRNDVKAILRYARDRGFGLIDTARSYGNSETLLGSMASIYGDTKVVTKIRPLPIAIDTHSARKFVSQSIEESLTALKRRSVYALLTHGPNDLLSPVGEVVYEEICRAKDRGLAQRIGISIYEPAELVAVASRFAIDAVQIPLNPLNATPLRTELLSEFAKRGIEI